MVTLFIFEVFTIICYISRMIIRKPSEYPDTTVGYRGKKARESKELWDFSNKLALKVIRYISIAMFILNIVAYLITNLENGTIIILINIWSIIGAICYIEFKISRFKIEYI
ncbi:SdpI family protein [Clostridium ihumii]